MSSSSNSPSKNPCNYVDGISKIEMSSSSNSPSKKPCNDVDGISISSLPEDLLVHITSKLGASIDTHPYYSLGKVSRKFRRISTDPYVLRTLHDKEVAYLKGSCNPHCRMKFQRVLETGHPEAIYQQGIDEIFKNGEHDLGMNMLLQASSLGNQKSTYLAGLILICLGGEYKPRGDALLSSLLEERVADSTMKLREIREEAGIGFWRDDPIMRGFKKSYTKDDCRCDGKTKDFFRYLRDRTSTWELLTADACKTCLWDHEFKQYFERFLA